MALNQTLQDLHDLYAGLNQAARATKNIAKTVGSEIKKEVEMLYKNYIKEREQPLLDAAAASVALSSLLFADRIEYSKITPQMEEAFHLAFPHMSIDMLADQSPESLAGFLAAWKGKYFEVLVRDKLNAGEWVGNVHLQPGQTAQLAEHANQSGWDLQIINADGSVAEELQLKATESLSYVKQALERYPDIQVMTTEEVFNHSEELSSQLLNSGISEQELQEKLEQPLSTLFDTTADNILETILPGLPFVIIAVSEGRNVMLGRKSFEVAMADSIDRAIKAGVSMSVGALVYFLDGGLLSIPASVFTRLSIDRYQILKSIQAKLENRMQTLHELQKLYTMEP